MEILIRNRFLYSCVRAYERIRVDSPQLRKQSRILLNSLSWSAIDQSLQTLTFFLYLSVKLICYLLTGCHSYWLMISTLQMNCLIRRDRCFIIDHFRSTGLPGKSFCIYIPIKIYTFFTWNFIFLNARADGNQTCEITRKLHLLLYFLNLFNWMCEIEHELYYHKSSSPHKHVVAL